jgi:SWI/SNF-related matrix-associated actin-dependent regulator of chromatin subfamily A-like protein 1
LSEVKMTYHRGAFYARTDFASRNVPREAGFYFEETKKLWRSSSVKAAVRLREYADEKAKKKLQSYLVEYSPWSGPLPYPKGLTPYEYQLEAARFSLSRSRSYLALDMGLGKSVIATMIANALNASADTTAVVPVVWVCPPFLARNVQDELLRWITYPADVARIDGGSAGVSGADILVVPDSILSRRSVYDDVWSTIRRSHSGEALLVVDEAHRFKNPEALRTAALFGDNRGEGGIASLFSRRVFLSGTPMPNRPSELYAVLSSQAPETIGFRNYFEYGARYCSGFKDERGHWNFSGASNLGELRANVYDRFMLRVRKSEVLTSLPPKTEEIVIIGDAPPELIAMEAGILREHSPEDLVAGTIASDHIATYRRELGSLKVRAAIEIIRALLLETKESLLVFAYHKDVISSLRAALSRFEPLVITGETPNDLRHEIVGLFQSSPRHRLFIGNYHAAGIGLTLTKASRVVMVEYDWNPSVNDQAADRAHRIGQRDNVFVQYLCYANSLDRKVMEVCLRKRKITAYI